MIPGNLFSAMAAENAVRGTPDRYEVFEGLAVTIPISELLANDSDDRGYLPLGISRIENFAGGRATMSGGFITFTSTGSVGADAGFDYVVKNRVNEEQAVRVTVHVKAKPPLVTNADTHSVIQGEQVLITAASLIANDTTTFPPMTIQSVGNPYGGTVSLVNNNITFTSTAKTGTPAGFTYNVRDAANNVAVGNVYMDVSKLPMGEAYLYASSNDARSMMDSYVPPSMQTVFRTWHRFDRTNYYPGGTTPGGQAASWSYNSSTGVITSTVNSDGHIGFVSPASYENYTHDCTLSSTAADDDVIGLIIAFKREGSVNKSLVAYRSGNGTPAGRWGIGLNLNAWPVAGDVYKTVTSTPIQSTGNWSSIGATRVRVQRAGDIVTVYTTPHKSTNFEPTSKIEINLASDSKLAWARGPQPYGYSCLSQQHSAFTNVTFRGALDVNFIADVQTNQVYQYVNNSWVPTGKTVADHVGYPRTVVNPDTGKIFDIDYNGNITILN